MRFFEEHQKKESWLDKAWHLCYFLKVLGNTVGPPYRFKNGTNEIDGESGPTLPARYVSALYYTLTSLTTIGFGNIAPNTTAEKLFGCVTMLLGGEWGHLILWGP